MKRVVLASMLLSSLAFAQVPETIGYQGLVLRADGTPVSGLQSLTFSLFASETGGAALWTETQQLGLSNGFYATQLGSVTPIPASVLDGSVLSLEVAIGGEVLTPRQRVNSVAYALVAGRARSVSGGPVDATELKVNGVTVVDTQGQLASSLRLTAGSGVEIDGANVISLLRTCSAGQVLKWDGATWACASDAQGSFTTGPGLQSVNGVAQVDFAAAQSRVTGTCAAGSSVRSIAADGTVACELDDDLEYLAGAGLTLTSNAFSVDTSSIQSRVSGTCAVGSAIRTIAADGTVSCEQNASYTAGNGLSLSGGAFSVDPTQVQTRVSSSCNAGSSIRSINADGTVTCETNASYAAGSGLSLSGSTFSVNTVAIQSRVSGTCAAGTSIRAIAADGTVTCETDDDASYTAGTGLSLSGTSFSVNTAAIQSRVSSACAAGTSIRAIAVDGTVTCETDDNASYAAGTGLSLTGTTFAVNTTTVQSRVSGACAAGTSIRAIAADGTVTCETDDSASYSAGTGLSLSGSSFAVDTATIQARVTGSCAAGQTISSIAADGTVTCVGPAQVLWVATSGGQYTTIGAAMNAINDASATKPYLVKVAPGTYSECVSVDSYVDIEGSGEGTTTVSCATGSYTMFLTTGSQVRNITLSNSYQPASGTTTAARINGVGSSLRHVTLKNTTALSTVAIVGFQAGTGAVAELDDVVVELATTTQGLAVFNTSGTVTVKNSELNGQNYGVYATGGTTRLINTLVTPRVGHSATATTVCINTFNSSYAAITNGTFTGTGTATTACAP